MGTGMRLAVLYMHLQPVFSDGAGQIVGNRSAPCETLQPKTQECNREAVGQARVGEVVDIVLTSSLAAEPERILPPADEPNRSKEQDVAAQPKASRSETFENVPRAS